jgi:hypothetical protein
MITPNEQIRFKYAVFNVTAELDETRLIVRTGVRTATAPLAKLQHLYVFDTAERGERELLLSYATARGGLRRVRVFADADEAGFDTLVQTLLRRRPEIDVRHLTAAEAYARTGTRQLEWLALPMMMGLVMVVLAVLFAPLLIHGFDGGHAEVTVAALEAGEPAHTRNVRVTGTLLSDYAVRAQIGADARLKQTTAWIPLVDAVWQPGTPVGAVLEVPAAAAVDLATLARAGAWNGMVRDIGWEGLPSRRRAEIAAGGVPLAPVVRLVQMGARPADDRGVALLVLGPLLIIMVLVSWRLNRHRRRPPPPARTPLAGRPADAGD